MTEMKGIELSRRYYLEYGEEMMRSFEHLLPYVAIGLAGCGSECLGFDDEISTDHDYDVGFCMWLTAEDYNKIGAKLQEKYDRLVGDNSDYNEFLRKRRGVFSINGFYNNLLGTVCNFEDKFKRNDDKGRKEHQER